MRDPTRITTSDGKPPEPGMEDAPAPSPEGPDGQHRSYWVLTEAERAKGFLRPVRQSYRHTACARDTKMGLAIAETFAREPSFYGATFCAFCRRHFPSGEFNWIDEQQQDTGEKVGS